jgi:hypothetical protein
LVDIVLDVSQEALPAYLRTGPKTWRVEAGTQRRELWVCGFEKTIKDCRRL